MFIDISCYGTIDAQNILNPCNENKNEMTNGVLSKANISRLKHIFTYCANKWYIFERIITYIYVRICTYVYI